VLGFWTWAVTTGGGRCFRAPKIRLARASTASLRNTTRMTTEHARAGHRGRLAARRRPAGGTAGQTGFAVEWLRDAKLEPPRSPPTRSMQSVLDLGLPRLDGRRLLEQCRARCDRTPVLVLTARDALDDRIAASTPAPTITFVKPVAIAEACGAGCARSYVARAASPGQLESAHSRSTGVPRVNWHGMAVDLAHASSTCSGLMLKAGRVVTRTSSSPRCTSGTAASRAIRSRCTCTTCGASWRPA